MATEPPTVPDPAHAHLLGSLAPERQLSEMPSVLVPGHQHMAAVAAVIAGIPDPRLRPGVPHLPQLPGPAGAMAGDTRRAHLTMLPRQEILWVSLVEVL